MLGVLYLLLCLLTGYVICNTAFPCLRDITRKSYSGEELNINSLLVLLPSWFVTGTLSVTWPVYFTAFLFRQQDEPLKYANSIVLPVFAIIGILYLLKRWKRREEVMEKGQGISYQEMLFLFLVIIFSSLLMWMTFFVKGDHLYVGNSVFSDFSPHLGMIRSFSLGNNFPTGYSHYAGEDIRYHFMFQFLTGNLEYLGLRINDAFNIPSSISLVSVYLLLYVLAAKISGKKTVGYLTCLLFTFRSSPSLFTFLANIPKGVNPFKELLKNTQFIGYTPNENWGLWNLNVYCNQRHLAFSLTVLLLVLLLFLPMVYRTFERDDITFFHIFLAKDGWILKDLKLPVAGGILLGSIAFWNGAVLIAALAVLFVFGIIARQRSELVLMAVIAVTMSLLQSRFFIHGKVVEPKLYFGFIAQNPTLSGSLSYMIKLLGPLVIVLAAAFLWLKGIKRYLMAAFLLPFVIAFTVSLTVDVTVNHKYIMISIMLLNIIAADFLIRLYGKKDGFIKTACIFITIFLTMTGVYDFYILVQKSKPVNAVVLDLNDPLTRWIAEHSDSHDIFLTSNYSLNQLVLGGAMLYQGWQYYGWSAGYDTEARDQQVKLMYEADTPLQLKKLVKRNQIRFIVIDYDTRNNKSYTVKEENVKNTYQCVYKQGDEETGIQIYDTSLPVG